MRSREVTVDTHQLERNEVQTAALETRDHLAHQATLHAIGLHQDEGAFDTHSAKV